MSKKRIRAVKTKPGDFGHDAVYVLPASAEAYERILEQAAREICGRLGQSWKHRWDTSGEDVKHIFRDDARAALRAIGITPPKKGQP